MLKVGMVGLGVMGQGMAKNLAEAGFLTMIYNRTIEKAHTFGEILDVSVALSIEELAAHVDVVCLCVSRDEDLLEVVHTLTKTIKPNSIVVDMSTVSSHTAKQAAAILAAVWLTTLW